MIEEAASETRQTPVALAQEVDPVFVVGPPRCGVRLLAAALDQQPELASGPELPFIATMAQQHRRIDEDLGAMLAQRHGLARSDVRDVFRRAVLSLLRPRLTSVGKSRAALHSFAGMLLVADLAAMFPRAHFIAMVRDPRDVALSLRRCDWRNPRNGRPLPYTRDAASAAQMWNEFLNAALPQLAPLLESGRALVLRYEDLCREPGLTMQRLGALCGCVMRAPHIHAEAAARIAMSLDNPHPALRAGAIDSTSVGRWRQALDPAGRTVIERVTARIGRQFGYALDE